MMTYTVLIEKGPDQLPIPMPVYGIVVNITTVGRTAWTKQFRPRTPTADSRN
jgi:hypothetical protein